MPHPVLDVVAEDPQIQHVHGEVQPVGVKEHGGHERLPVEPRGHQAMGQDEGHELAVRHPDLDQERAGVDEDEQEGDDRRGAGWNHIPERDHPIIVMPCRWAASDCHAVDARVRSRSSRRFTPSCSAWGSSSTTTWPATSSRARTVRRASPASPARASRRPSNRPRTASSP